MPFSRYQIRNEFSLADPELYKAADKDDPEALLEGVAMAGLVGVLRQLGDLAEFAAEIFHGLHEEVMVTATRGHGLLVRVQQLESDFPSIERVFLSQTGHSAFFSSSGISWHPNLQTEQNLITRGDLPRFVMDSYEECRGPPRLFLLDKFDVAGAGACLKRYTDPSFYKMEASSYEMASAEAQRDKRIRKTKKKGSRLKNRETHEVFQPSHVKLHQLLLEERVQNGASELSRRVKLKKRQIKFPFDTESGEGYMEKLISSSPEDKLVHEEKLLSVDKLVSREHVDNMLENVPETLPISTNGAQPAVIYSAVEEEVEEKHISADGYQSDDVASETDNYMDALPTMESEIETDAELRANSDASIKQKTSSDANVDQLQPQSSDEESTSIRNKIVSFSYSDTASPSTDNMSPRGVDSSQAFACTEIPFHPRVSQNDAALPLDQGTIFRESDYREKSSNNCLDVNSPKRTEDSQIVPEAIVASTSELADDHSPTIDDPSLSSIVRNPEYDIDDEDNNSNSTLVISHAEGQPFDPSLAELDICDADVKPSEGQLTDDASSSSIVRNPECDVDNEDQNSNSTLVISHVEGHLFGPSLEELDICDPDVKPSEDQLTDDLHVSKFDPTEAGVSYSSEDETELKDTETVSVDSESKTATTVVSDPADDRNGDNNLVSILEREPESVNSETKDAIAAVSGPDNVDNNGSKSISTCENTELEEKEVESIDSETEPMTSSGAIEKNEDNGLSTTDEPSENGLVINELGVIQDSKESVEKMESNEQSIISPESNIQFLDSIHNPSAEKESSEKSVISPELESESSASYDHSKTQNLDSICTSSMATCDDFNEDNVDNQSANLEILQDETLFAIEKPDQTDVLPDVNFQPGNQSNTQFLDSAQSGLNLDIVTAISPSSKCVDQDQDLESKSVNQFDGIEKLEAASSILNHSVPIEEKHEQPHLQSFLRSESIDSQNHVDQETRDSEPYPMNHESYCVEPSRTNLSNQVEYPPPHVYSGFNMLPQLAPINLDEMPPLPPLPPMQWRMGKLQNASLISTPDNGQHTINRFPPAFPQNVSHPSLDQKENAENQKSEHDHEDTESSSQVLLTESSLHTEQDGNLVTSFAEQIVPQPLVNREQSENVSTSGQEIFWPSNTSSLPPADDQRPNGIRPMKIQRPRTPLIDAVAAHDKSMLRKVSERARPLPKEEERDTLLEQIRAKSFNLKPAVQTRPSIQGPSTNLRVAAILEKANAIRHAFAGSDDDDDGDDDSWSDS